MHAVRQNTCVRTVGRLVEIHLEQGFRSVGDVDEVIAAMDTLVAGMAPSERIITAADWRNCTVMGTGTAERAIAMLVRRNPQTLRSGTPLSSGRVPP
jgi:hypothetical protein